MPSSGHRQNIRERAIRIRHGALPDLSVSRKPRNHGAIVASSGTKQQPAQHDDNENNWMLTQCCILRLLKYAKTQQAPDHF